MGYCQSSLPCHNYYDKIGDFKVQIEGQLFTLKAESYLVDTVGVD